MMIFFTSCNKNKPKNVISEEKFISLMIDLLLLEANYSLINMQAYNVKSKMMDSLYFLVYEKHNTDSVAFKQTIEYYAKFPEDYLAIMNAVKDSLNTIDSIALIKYGKKEIIDIPKNPLDIQKALKDSMRLERKRLIRENIKNINSNNN